MLSKSSFALSLVCLIFASACTKTPVVTNESNRANGIRALNEIERTEDFDAMVKAFKELYGPLEYKEKRFGFKIDEIAAEYRARVAGATTDIEVYGIMKEFITRFQDGHVSLESSLIAPRFHAVPIFLTPFGNRAIIAQITDPSIEKEMNIAVGDEVLKVDGVAPSEFMPTINKYGSFGNELSSSYDIRHVLRRPLYIKELKPTKSNVELTIQKPDGTIIERSLIWDEVSETTAIDKRFVTIPNIHSVLNNSYSPATQGLIQGTLADMGAEAPFFMTAQVKAQSKALQVKPSAQALQTFGITDASKVPDLFAMIYKYEGKTVLLLRQSTYSIPNKKERIAWYKALLSEYEPLADVIVVDQTHNPGGDLEYAQEFTALFANQKTRSLVNFLNGDRKWLDMFGTALHSMRPVKNENQEAVKTFELGFKLVEEAYDNGGGLTKEPIGLAGYNYLGPKNAVGGKPVLVLINELAGSCGDIFPYLMKENHLATLFGKRTMGLGGNVEAVMKLPNSQFSLSLTRGLFAIYSPEGSYPDDRFIENNGVLPDIEHDISVDDFRAGYTEYFKAFSKAAVGLVK